MQRKLFVLGVLASAAACQTPTEPVAERDVQSPELSYSRENDDNDDDQPGTRKYKVTLVNLTTGQPMSPGVVVTHSRQVDLFSVHKRASAGIQAIAENGDPAVSFGELNGRRGVGSLLTTTAPLHRVGGPGPNELSVTVTTERGMRRLSVAVMLICTNDGFTGLDGIRLPNRGRAVYYARGYDAGTEENTEAAGDIVPPCFGIGPVTGLVGGGGRVGETRRIRHHPNILGGGDLTKAHYWRDPVLKVIVERID
jgi:hypothetical protein